MGFIPLAMACLLAQPVISFLALKAFRNQWALYAAMFAFILARKTIMGEMISLTLPGVTSHGFPHSMMVYAIVFAWINMRYFIQG